MQTVIGVFESNAQAQAAVDRLVQAGFSRSAIHQESGASYADTDVTGTTTGSTAGTTTSGRLNTDDMVDTGGLFDRIGAFFSSLFGDDDTSSRSATYNEAARRGHAIVAVDAENDDRLDDASDILDDCGAVDIDERETQWRSEGWSGGTALAGAGTSAALGSTTAAGFGATSDTSSTADTQGTTVLPVIEEELKVGKRAVERGRVRVVQRVVETPISETVRLREEHARVERRSVDRPATEADFAELRDSVVEVRETAEEAVVAKEARVVEEVVVGKEVTEREETLSDTVRRTDVEVERIDDPTATGSASGTSATTRTGGLPNPGGTISSTSGTSGGTGGTTYSTDTASNSTGNSSTKRGV